jgi:PAS domain S-box-containing protein
MKSGAPTLSKSTLTEILNDHSIDAIIAIDTAYNVIAWNKTAALIYGVSKTQAMGKPVFQLIPSLKQDEETCNAINKTLSGQTTFISASKHFTHRLHKENHYIPLINNDGILIGAMNIVHDVAHRIKAEQQLQNLNEELERKVRQLKITSDELASFTYITSSKIKEPIRQIYTGVEHLIKVEANHLTDSGKASFRRMQSSLNRMDLLLDDVLSLAQISILEKTDTAVDLNELVKEVANHIKKVSEKKVNITIEELCIINGHESYLYLLFNNLLDNAVKFNENEVAEITVNCEKVVLNEMNEQFIEEEYFCVTITDNGIGFDMPDTERMFLMFEKLNPPGKYKGSGTGLTIARKIMEAHNGFIEAESIPGKGSSFHCYFSNM